MSPDLVCCLFPTSRPLQVVTENPTKSVWPDRARHERAEDDQEDHLKYSYVPISGSIINLTDVLSRILNIVCGKRTFRDSNLWNVLGSAVIFQHQSPDLRSAQAVSAPLGQNQSRMKSANYRPE